MNAGVIGAGHEFARQLLVAVASFNLVWGDAVAQAGAMKIRIDVNGTSITAELADNETARDFASLLPLSLTLKDYAGTEKISDLPRKLSTKNAPAGTKPSIGDISYYAPWGNVAIYYKDFDYSTGLIKLGRLDSGIEVLSKRAGPTKVTIELMGK